MDMDPTTMMMVATFQQILIQMLMTGNTELIIPGTLPMARTIHGTIPTEWEMDQAPGSMDMGLNTMMMAVISLLILMLMHTTGSMETTIPGITLTAPTTHGTIPTIWEMDQEPMTGLTQVTQFTLHT